MKNQNYVEAEITMISYEDGEPVITEREISGTVSNEIAEELINLCEDYENQIDEFEDSYDTLDEDDDLDDDETDVEERGCHAVKRLAERTNIISRCVEEMFKLDRINMQEIDDIRDEIRGVKRIGKVVVAAEILLGIGFILAGHHKKNKCGKVV